MTDPGRLIEATQALASSPCTQCGQPICLHEAVLSIYLGFKAAPNCLGCVAAALAQPTGMLAHDAIDRLLRRDCYAEAWHFATEREQGACKALQLASPAPGHDAGPRAAPPTLDHALDAAWDAGDMGCGELVLELRLRMNALAPGAVLELTATDTGAREDIPAWCGLTGHVLVGADHPKYFIRRRET